MKKLIKKLFRIKVKGIIILSRSEFKEEDAHFLSEDTGFIVVLVDSMESIKVFK